MKCPKCGGELVLKRSKKGRIYYGCENSPDCDFMSWARPVAKPCPVCGSYMVLRGSRHLCSNTACGHSENAVSEE